MPNDDRSRLEAAQRRRAKAEAESLRKRRDAALATFYPAEVAVEPASTQNIQASESSTYAQPAVDVAGIAKMLVNGDFSADDLGDAVLENFVPEPHFATIPFTNISLVNPSRRYVFNKVLKPVTVDGVRMAVDSAIKDRGNMLYSDDEVDSLLSPVVTNETGESVVLNQENGSQSFDDLVNDVSDSIVQDKKPLVSGKGAAIAAGVAALGTALYLWKRNKRKKNTDTEKAAGVASAVAYSLPPGELANALLTATTPEKVKQLNKDFPELGEETVKFLTGLADREKIDDGASIVFDRFSTPPGVLAKQLDSWVGFGDSINEKLTSDKGVPFDFRDIILRQIAAGMLSPFGTPSAFTKQRTEQDVDDDALAESARMRAEADELFGDTGNPDTLYPGAEWLGYRIPAITGNYLSRVGKSEPAITDAEGRRKVVENSLSDLFDRYPSARNMASALVNGGFGRFEDLPRGKDAYYQSGGENVYRGPLWDYGANAFNEHGTNAVINAVGGLYSGIDSKLQVDGKPAFYYEDYVPEGVEQMLKLFDTVGPHAFRKDTVAGPQALFHRSGGVIADATKLKDEFLAPYKGQEAELKSIFDSATGGVADKAISAVADKTEDK